MSSNPPADFTHLEVLSYYTLLGGTSPAAADGLSHWRQDCYSM